MKTDIEKIKSGVLSLFQGVLGVSATMFSEPGELILSASRSVQALRNKRFINQLLEELNMYKDKGTLKDQFYIRDKFQEGFVSLMTLLDTKVISEDIFYLLKAILVSSVHVNTTEEDEIEAHMIMEIAKDLTSSQYLILTACHKVSIDPNKKYHGVSNAGDWIRGVLEFSPIRLPALIELEDEKLVEKGLLEQRKFGDKSGIRIGAHFRQTDLCKRMFELIEQYEKISV